MLYMDSSTADSMTAVLAEREMTLKCQSVTERPYCGATVELLGITLNIQLAQFPFRVSTFHLMHGSPAEVT
jgi:hypothetical protein